MTLGSEGAALFYVKPASRSEIPDANVFADFPPPRRSKTALTQDWPSRYPRTETEERRSAPGVGKRRRPNATRRAQILCASLIRPTRRAKPFVAAFLLCFFESAATGAAFKNRSGFASDFRR